MKFVDIHTHSASGNDVIELINHEVQNQWNPQPEMKYTVGFHPWRINQYDKQAMISKVGELSHSQQVVAIGECGLDRHIDIPSDHQEAIFLQQLKIAETVNKPLIIHAVKTYSDLIQLKKKSSSSVPWILHGYNGNIETTRQLINHNFYFSLGEKITKENAKLIESLRSIPTNRLFLETDTSSTKIETIYIFASKWLGLELNELKGLIYNNYKQIFEG